MNEYSINSITVNKDICAKDTNLLCANIWNLSIHELTQKNEYGVLEYILLLEELANFVELEVSRIILIHNTGKLCNEIGVQFQDITYLEMAKGYFNIIVLADPINFTIFEHLFRRGRNLYYLHQLTKRNCINKQIDFDYYTSAKENLFSSHAYLKICVKQGIIKGGIKDNQNTHDYVIFHMVDISGELNRWVEFDYYFDFLEKKNEKAEYYHSRARILHSFMNSAHTNIYPSLLSEIIRNCESAIDLMEDEGPNLEVINDIKDKSGKLLNRLYPDYNNNSTSHNSEPYKHTKYRNWTLENHLSLNEHAIFCKCKLSSKDDLSLKTLNVHTQSEWIDSFQILIEQLKIDFDFARLSYYNSLSENKMPSNHNTVEMPRKQVRDRLLINSFKLTYSILDKISVSLFSIFSDLGDKEAYFHSLCDYIKNKGIRNKYLLSIESIAFELHHQNPNAVLKDYMIWRNAIEHNFFFLDVEEKDIRTNLKRVTTVSKDKFISSTMHLLQLTRSCIFSLVFLIRDEACMKQSK